MWLEVGENKIEVLQKGAELKQLIVKGNHLFSIKNDWGRTAPFLFPFVGKIREDKFIYEGKEYPVPRHGFVRDQDFELTVKDNRIIASLAWDKFDKYPFKFVYKVIYTLGVSSIHINIMIEADGDACYNLGWHPAFNTKALNVESNNIYTINEAGIIDSKKRNTLNEISVDDITDDETYIFDWYNPTFKINDLEVTLKAKANQIAIWSSNKEQFLCIEPWFKAIDNVESAIELNDKDLYNGSNHFEMELVWKGV